jgi:DNA polymerase-3 subunit beta
MTATKERKKTRAGGISLSAPELKAALAAVGQAVTNRSPRPIYHSVLLSGSVLTGGDGDIRIDVTLENTPPGVNFLLPKDRFSAILNSFSGDEITITPDDTSCVIKAGRGEWTLPTEDASEYPAWDVVDAKPVTRLPVDQFCRAVKGVVFAVDDESSRYALGAVLVEVKGEVVTFVATDGRRLSCVTCEHDLAVDDRREPEHKGEKVEPALLVPARAMAIIARLAAGCGDASVQLEATKNEIVATVANATVTARLLDGRYPRWRDTLPERDAKATTVSRADLLAATRAAAIVTSDESKGVQFVFSDGGIWLHGQSAEKGESSVTCDVVEAGDKATVKLDPLFVQQWLGGIDSEAEPEVEVEAVDAQSAVILRCGDNTGVIMPLAAE